jgi:hypothetical protein
LFRSALASFETRSGLVDDINAALAAYQLVVPVAALERLERILDFHRFGRSVVLSQRGHEKRASRRAEMWLCNKRKVGAMSTAAHLIHS